MNGDSVEHGAATNRQLVDVNKRWINEMCLLIRITNIVFVIEKIQIYWLVANNAVFRKKMRTHSQ